MRAPSVHVVDWYRSDPLPRMRRVLIAGPAVLTTGGLVIAVSFLTHQTHSVRVEAAVAGLVLVAAGAIFTTVSMHRLLRDDAYLAIRTDGVAVHSRQGETLVAWDELERAHWDAERLELVIERRTSSAITLSGPFSGIAGPALVDRLQHARRKAAMGLLR